MLSIRKSLPRGKKDQEDEGAQPPAIVLAGRESLGVTVVRLVGVGTVVAVAAVVAAVAAVVVEEEVVVVEVLDVVGYEQFLERSSKASSLMGEVFKEGPKASVKIVVFAEVIREIEVWE